MRRWSPTVVPALPPTGVAGVGSLKPTPAGSVFTRMTCAACVASDAAPRRTPAQSALKEVFIALLLRQVVVGSLRALVGHAELAVGALGRDDRIEVVERALDGHAAIGARHRRRHGA